MSPLRIGHRGAAGRAPENTLASFRMARELGCDAVELDVHRSADGHLVVIHDPWLDRTTAGRGLVRDLTLAQIQQWDAGSWYAPPFAGEQVPTLAAVLAATEPMRLFIELKAGSIHYPGIEEDLLRLIAAARGRVQVSSFDHQALRRLRDLSADLPLGMLYEGNPLDPVAMARQIGATAIHPYWAFVTPQLVAAAHAAGLECHVWTVNRPEFVAMMIACGVDGIISDTPEILPARAAPPHR